MSTTNSAPPSCSSNTTWASSWTSATASSCSTTAAKSATALPTKSATTRPSSMLILVFHTNEHTQHGGTEEKEDTEKTANSVSGVDEQPGAYALPPIYGCRSSPCSPCWVEGSGSRR